MPKILECPRVVVANSTIVADDLNENLDYLRNSIQHRINKRFVNSFIQFPLNKNASTPLTNATNPAVLRYLYKAPCFLVVDRLFIEALGSGDISVNITVNGSVPNGISNPAKIMTLTSELDSVSVNNQILLNQNDILQVEITGSSFSIDAGVATLHLRSDRHNITGTATVTGFTPTLYRSKDVLDADDFNSMINSAVSKATGIFNDDDCYKSEYVTFFDLTAATTARHATWKLPTTAFSSGDRRLLSGRINVVASSTGGIVVNITMSRGATTFINQNITITAGNGAGSADITVLEDELFAASSTDISLVISKVSGADNADKVTVQLNLS